MSGSASARTTGHVYDIGAMWRDWSVLPMVFAVWAVRRSVANSFPDRVARFQTLVVHNGVIVGGATRRMLPAS